MVLYYPAREIVPGLWIGSQGDSESAAFLRRHNIGLVVNCSRNILFTAALQVPGVSMHHIEIDDAPSEAGEFLDKMPAAVREIDAVLARGKGVLVHCRAGMQRSAGTVAAYLMYSRKMDADEAMAFIRRRKPETFTPWATFGNALRTYARRLKNGTG